DDRVGIEAVCGAARARSRRPSVALIALARARSLGRRRGGDCMNIRTSDMADSTRSWVRPLKPNPQANLPAFSFPHAGAGALADRPWCDLFPSEIELCAIQLPGRDDRFRETPFTDVHALVAVLARVLYPYELSRPFAFYGHSMGALVAYELTRVLIDRYGVSPVHLFVSARNAPQVRDPRPPLYSLPDPQFIEQLRLLNGTPEELLREADPMWIRMLRADFELNEA